MEELPQDQPGELPQCQEEVIPDIEIELVKGEDVQEAICLSALPGNNNMVNTILVNEIIKRRTLLVFMDSGSTYSFINESRVQETGYQETYTTPIRVTVADGNCMFFNTTCTNSKRGSQNS